MGKTKIEWTKGEDGEAGMTWNPIRGCSRVSEGCRHCYAERLAARSLPGLNSPKTGLPFAAVMADNHPHWTGKVELIESMLDLPLHWRKPRKIFVNSMSDLFHEALLDEAIDRVFTVMAMCPQHTFQVLTKRPERMMEYLSGDPQESFYNWGALAGDFLGHGADGRVHKFIGEAHSSDYEEWIGWPLPNVWLGVSVEDRAHKGRIDLLRKTPAAVRFLSLEPLLEDLGELDLTGINLVIVGGESGPGARPCDVAWIRSIIQRCKSAGVACFVKQLGANPIETDECDECDGYAENRNGNPCVRCDATGEFVSEWHFKDRKGGDMDEWPHELRVREMPEVSR